MPGFWLALAEKREAFGESENLLMGYMGVQTKEWWDVGKEEEERKHVM